MVGVVACGARGHGINPISFLMFFSLSSGDRENSELANLKLFGVSTLK